MSVNMNSTPMNDPSTSESETPMFSAIPAWERNRKRRGFGGGKSRSAAASPPASIGEAPAYAAPVDSTEGAFATPPAYATRTTTMKRSGGVAPLAIAAGIIAIGGLAAAGWYANQPHDTGVAQLTPGTEAATAPVATAPAAMPELAANTAPTQAPAPAATTTTTTTAKAATPATRTSTTTRVAAARTRPAPASRSAEDAGVNTSATLPAAPQPYSGTAVAPSAPADVAPAPAPVQAAPQPVNPAPPQTAVTPPTSVTPPVASPPQ